MKPSQISPAIPGVKSIYVRVLSVMLALFVISGGVVLLGVSLKSDNFLGNEPVMAGFNCFFLTIPVASVASFFIARTYAEPIVQLVEDTKAAARGKFNRTARIRTGDEIEELAKAVMDIKAEMENLIYTLSHDLKTPLITIQGFAGMLKKDLEENKRDHIAIDLNFIEDAISKMDSLLRDAIKFSQVGRVENPPEYLPFGNLVEEALEQSSAEIQKRGIEVSVADDLPVVHVDRAQMVEMMIRLIENSIDNLGNQQHPKIDIGHRREDGEDVFFVKDNGMGIDSSQHEKVFGLFYKLNQNSRGTGAGLAIVKRIIELHGGRIWIESEKDKGCTVYSALPCAA